jgi:hypothetical protein
VFLEEHHTECDGHNEDVTVISRLIDGCIANDQAMRADIWKAGLPLEALRSLAMQGSIEFVKKLLPGFQSWLDGIVMDSQTPRVNMAML